MDGIQIVNFEKYCPKCTYKKLTEQEEERSEFVQFPTWK